MGLKCGQVVLQWTVVNESDPSENVVAEPSPNAGELSAASASTEAGSTPDGNGDEPPRISVEQAKQIAAPFDQTPKHGRYILAPDSAPGMSPTMLARLTKDDLGERVETEVRRLISRGVWSGDGEGTRSFLTARDREIVTKLGGPIVERYLKHVEDVKNSQTGSIW